MSSSKLPLSQQAAPNLEGLFNQLWHKSWNATGRTRSRGLKATTKRPKALTAKERAYEAFSAACETANPETIIAAAKKFAEEAGDYTPCLGTWLEEGRWETVDVVSGNASKIEARPVSGKTWQQAQGQVKQALQAMSELGCADDILDALYGDGVGITHINCDRGVPPTLVFRTDYGLNKFLNAASGYAKRAGYNEVGYQKTYVEAKRKRLDQASSAST